MNTAILYENYLYYSEVQTQDVPKMVQYSKNNRWVVHIYILIFCHFCSEVAVIWVIHKYYSCWQGPNTQIFGYLYSMVCLIYTLYMVISVVDIYITLQSIPVNIAKLIINIQNKFHHSFPSNLILWTSLNLTRHKLNIELGEPGVVGCLEKSLDHWNWFRINLCDQVIQGI